MFFAFLTFNLILQRSSIIDSCRSSMVGRQLDCCSRVIEEENKRKFNQQLLRKRSTKCGLYNVSGILAIKIYFTVLVRIKYAAKILMRKKFFMDPPYVYLQFLLSITRYSMFTENTKIEFRFLTRSKSFLKEN